MRRVEGRTPSVPRPLAGEVGARSAAGEGCRYGGATLLQSCAPASPASGRGVRLLRHVMLARNAGEHDDQAGTAWAYSLSICWRMGLVLVMRASTVSGSGGP